MLKRVGLIVGIILHPLAAQAAACKLEQATFRPRFSAEHFVLRSARDGIEGLQGGHEVGLINMHSTRSSALSGFAPRIAVRRGRGCATSPGFASFGTLSHYASDGSIRRELNERHSLEVLSRVLEACSQRRMR
jgi:hypothetical protein